MSASILCVDHAPVYGGAEAVLVRMLAVLDPARYSPLVVLGPCTAMEQSLAAVGVPYRVMPLCALNRRDWKTAPAALAKSIALARLARHERCAIIHTNTLRAHILGIPAAAQAGLPLIWTLHDVTFPRRLFRLLSARPAAIICVSQTIRNRYAPYCSRPEALRVIYNGVEPRRVSATQVAGLRQSLGAGSETPIVAIVGRLIRGKGQDIFVRAAAAAGARHPAALFVVAGGAVDETSPTGQLIPFSALNAGGTAYERELHTLAADLGLAERVRFTGFLDDPSALYEAASIVVHAGTMPEGLPTAPIEAMAMGRPVIGSDLTAIREIVEDGRTGIIVPPGEVAALATAMADLLSEPERAKTMGAAGQMRASSVFSLKRQVTETSAVYDQILLARRARIGA
jgi:glycosyltransferase involved in cell wall biosynthesis